MLGVQLVCSLECQCWC